MLFIQIFFFNWVPIFLLLKTLYGFFILVSLSYFCHLGPSTIYFSLEIILHLGIHHPITGFAITVLNQLHVLVFHY